MYSPIFLETPRDANSRLLYNKMSLQSIYKNKIMPLSGASGKSYTRSYEDVYATKGKQSKFNKNCCKTDDT